MSGEGFLRLESINFFGGVWKIFFVFVSSGNIFEIFVDFTSLYDEFERRVQDFHCSEKLAMHGGDVDCIVS